MNRCPKCGRPMVTNMYWDAGNPAVEWYCPRCGKVNDKYIYTTNTSGRGKGEE